MDVAASDSITSSVVFDDDGPGPHAPALFVSGRFTSIGGIAANSLAKWNGTLWSPVGQGVTGVRDLVVYDDDGPGPHLPALYTLGILNNTLSLLKWDGIQWTSLASLYGFFSHLYVLNDTGTPRLYLSETVQTVSPGNLATNGRFYRVDDPAHLTWLFQGGDVNAAAVWDPDGAGPLPPQIVLAHTHSDFAWSAPYPPPPPTLDSRITRLGAGGPVDLVVGGTLQTAFRDLAVYDDDAGGPGASSLYVAGNYELTPGGAVAEHLSRLTSAGLAPIAGDVDGAVAALRTIPSDPFAQGSPTLYALGQFAHIGGAAATSIARWNGVTWSRLGPGFSLVDQGQTVTTSPSTLCIFDDDGAGPRPAFLYAGGSFSTAGYAPSNGIVRWDGFYWAPAGPVINNAVHALLSADLGSGPTLYIGGQFTAADGIPASSIARWDGQAFSAFPLGGNNHVDALGVFQGQLVAAGKFTLMGGVPVGRIARYTGSTWSPFGAGFDGNVSALAVFDDQRGGGPALYAAGQFTHSAGQPMSRIARWTGQAWAPLSAGTDGDITALAVIGNGLYAGGPFTSAGGQPAPGVARWDGSAWTPLPPTGAAVETLAVHRGVLYAGGAAGGGTALISAWNGRSWFALPALSGAADAVHLTTLASVSDDGVAPPVLYASGEFTVAGGVAAAHLARWDGTSWAAIGDGLDAPARAITRFYSALALGGDFLSAGGLTSWFLAPLVPACAPVCEPNCDASTAPPLLNVNDFVCYLNRFAAGDPYANCDGSTTPPVLNILDFTCFLNRFAAGCS